MRIGIVGYGSVATLHAVAFAAMPDIELAVWGPDRGRAADFARSSRSGCTARSSLEELLEWSHGVVVASPSQYHEAQAEAALRVGRATLVEIPACGSARAGRRLGAIAAEAGAVLLGVHSSRFLAPYAQVGEMLAAGRIGEVQRVAYRRGVRLRPRSWRDDALRHHAAHPLDLLLHWLGPGVATRCTSWVEGDVRTAVRAEARFGGDVLASIEVAYGSGSGDSLLRVAGSRGIIETDGFSWVSENGVVGPQRWAAETAYAASIAQGDALFADSIRGRAGAPGWEETVRLARLTDALQSIEVRRVA